MSSNSTSSAPGGLKRDPLPGWLLICFAVGTFLLFSPAVEYDFVDYDDGLYVYANKMVLHGLTWDSVRYAFTTIDGGSWMPLTWLSYMLDVAVFGPSPGGFHGMNLLLHVLSSAGLLLLLHRLTGRVWLSLIAAALFAWHPLRNESVVWIAERKDVLSALFWMLGLLAYLRYVNRPTLWRYAAVGVALLLGLMTKPMFVTFPFVLLLLDFWPLGRLGHDGISLRANLWPRLREKLPWLVLVAVVCVLTVWSQHRVGALDRGPVVPLDRLMRVLGNYAFYLQKMLLPVDLTILYPAQLPAPAAAVASGALLAGVTSATLWQAFRRPWLTVGWLWFLGTLVPVIGLVSVGHITAADRYSYLPSIGIALMIVWGVAEPFAKGSGRQRVAGGIGIALACWCAVLTWMDLPRWQSSIPLFQAANRVHPHPVAYNNIGVCYLDAKQYDRAIDPLSRALELDTNYYKAFVNRATAYQKLGRIEEARRDYELILKREPKSPEGYNNRANVLLDLQDYDRAIADFSALIRLMPASAQAYNNRGAAWFMKGDNAAAIADCDQALALDPRYANAYTTRGNARSRQGDLAGALADFDRALELSPLDSLAYHNRAAVCYQLKQYDRAWQDLQRCRDLGGKPHEGLVQALMEATGRQR